jgi:Ni/Fe-hydrogenase subunit HybB-like protein
MASATAGAVAAPQSFIREKILLGKSLKEYVRSCCTPMNAVAAVILAVGIPLIVYRFGWSLAATTNLSQSAPWGIWIGFDMMTGIVLAAGGFTIGATVQLFGLKAYHPIERAAILTAFLGYVMAICGLLADLGRPWNMVMIFASFGTASALFEVAWCVVCYSSVLFLEFTVPAFEWLGWKKIHSVMKKTLVALTVLSVMFSSMHQSALGSLFLLAPTKLHPLWYTPFIFIFFFLTAVIAGISMVIVESAISHKVFHSQVAGQHVDVDKLTLGLGKAGALVMFAYFFLKLQGVIDGHAWGYLATGYGAWFLVEIVGFVLLPAFLYAYGARNGKVKIVRIGGVMGVLGIVLNRLNVSVIAFNWNQPVRYVPSWMEVWVSVTLVTIGVLLFRWIVNRMPILREDPRFAESHH